MLLIFLLANTIWSLLDLAGSPQTIPERLAKSLTQYNARAFSMSYVMLQGIGIMPFQLVNIGSLFFICVYRALFNLTPRELDALYAPPAINYGMIYPPAILIFIVTLVYSVLSPLILLFGAVYFGFAYVVYKYKLINVFVNPYESTGEAWPITFARLVWGIVLFQLFMTGLFAARTSVFASTGMIPLLLGTVVWSWIKREDLKGLSSHTPLAYIAGDSDFSPESRSRDEQREQVRALLARVRKTRSLICVSQCPFGRPSVMIIRKLKICTIDEQLSTVNANYRKSCPSRGYQRCRWDMAVGTPLLFLFISVLFFVSFLFALSCHLR